ncbi:MAG TPA: FGGY-family carbohydrate kinase, partial [Thermoanaerobaculia bacterium]|nr:FGGY-family carbohydrate kinase [Thermoanaerobaculia bacterium]
MSGGDLLLSIDAGTQSVRALLFDAAGNLVDKARVAIEPYVSPRPGWAEQDPDVYVNAASTACRELLARDASYRERIAAVAPTTQRATVVNVGKDGRPLRPAIVWLDQRRVKGMKPVGGLHGLAFRLLGLRETIAYFQAEAEANWIAREEPEIAARTHRFLFLSGYLTHWLTGRYADSTGGQVGYAPFDFKKLAWAPEGDWKWKAVAVKREWLPDLVPPGSPLGEITKEAAEATGVRAGTPVVAAAADKACEVLGAGGLSPDVGCLSYGTTATINTTHERYVEPVPLLPPYPAAVPHAYNLEVQVYRGFWMVSWFRKEFGHLEELAAKEAGVDVEALFDRLVTGVPAGSMGLMLQPYWSPGLKIPGPEAKGAVVGFGDVHGRAHLYRAILEGLAFALREGKERTEKRSGVPIRELRVAGGGSQSDAAMQITADVFGLPASRPHVYEASGLGAAIDAAVGVGMHPDFKTAVKAMTR